jgi:hypothetical protein
MYAINVYSFEIKYFFFGKFFFILNYFDLLIGKINFKKYIILIYFKTKKKLFIPMQLPNKSENRKMIYLHSF